MFNLTSYDVPRGIRDRINACATVAEVIAIRDSVKAPSQCAAGDPDLTVWWACTAVINANRADAQSPVFTPTDHQLGVMEWVNSLEYDNE